MITWWAELTLIPIIYWFAAIAVAAMILDLVEMFIFSEAIFLDELIIRVAFVGFGLYVIFST